MWGLGIEDLDLFVVSSIWVRVRVRGLGFRVWGAGASVVEGLGCLE